MTPERPAWHGAAACHGLTRLFFPSVGEDTTAAKAVCRACPVQAPCADAGRNERFGIWGGNAERTRKRTRVSLTVVDRRVA